MRAKEGFDRVEPLIREGSVVGQPKPREEHRLGRDQQSEESHGHLPEAPFEPRLHLRDFGPDAGDVGSGRCFRQVRYALRRFLRPLLARARLDERATKVPFRSFRFLRGAPPSSLLHHPLPQKGTGSTVHGARLLRCVRPMTRRRPWPPPGTGAPRR